MPVTPAFYGLGLVLLPVAAYGEGASSIPAGVAVMFFFFWFGELMR